MSWYEECFYTRLKTACDDYGRMDARPPILKARLFPLKVRLSLKDIEDALYRLADIGCVKLYECDGKPYLYLPDWEDHQRVRNKRAKYPDPADCSESRRVAADCSELRPKSNPIRIQSESKSESKSESESKEDAFASYAGDNEALFSALNEFRKMRKIQKSPMTGKAESLLISALEKLSTDPETQIAILNQSIMNGWKSVYALKEDGRKEGSSGERNGAGTQSAAGRDGMSLDMAAYQEMVTAKPPKYRKDDQA